MFTVFTNTKLLATPGAAIGDINYASASGNGHLLPISYGKYFTLDFEVEMKEIQEFTATYKQEMRKKWAAETGVENLSAAALASIEKINTTNIIGFLFRESIKTDFSTASDYDWLFFKIIPSIADKEKVALWLDGDGEQWDEKKWEEEYCNMPPFIPQSEEISAMRDKFEFFSSKAHMFEDGDGQQHFILDDVYKGFFEDDLWLLKRNNDHVYMHSYKINDLEKRIFRKKTNTHLFPV